MASITIRNLDESVKKALRRQAAQNGHSMEEEARFILRRELFRDRSLEGLGSRISEIWADAALPDGIPLPPRDAWPKGADPGDDEEK